MKLKIFSENYRKHYLSHLKLAYPVVIGQAGHIITSIADTVMVGQLGSTPLAAASLANTVFVVPFVFGIGVSYGLTPLVGKAFGEKNNTLCRNFLFNGLISNFLLGILISAFIVLSAGVLHALDQPPDVVNLAIPYFKIVAYSMIPYMVFLSMKQFLEGIQITKPLMIISLVFNVMNIGFNYLFIYGKAGFPELGLNGAGVATLIARTLMAVSVCIYFFSITKFRQFHVFRLDFLKIKLIKQFFKIGIPVGVQFSFEIAFFSVGAIIIGWSGSQSLAAHQIALNLAALTYMMATGIAASATMRVSYFYGEKKFSELKMSAYSAFVLVAVFMSVCGMIFILANDYFPTLFIAESEVIHIAAGLLVAAAFFQVFDGLQVTILGALRGIADVNVPTVIILLSYWLIGLPLCYLFAVILQFGARGVWLGYLCGLFLISLLSAIRLKKQLRKIKATLHA